MVSLSIEFLFVKKYPTRTHPYIWHFQIVYHPLSSYCTGIIEDGITTVGLFTTHFHHIVPGDL